MPRSPRAIEAAPTPSQQLARVNTVLASAATLTRKNMARPKTTGSNDWQNEAWYFYDTVGEFRFGVNWKAHALSQCELIIEELQGTEWEKIDEGLEVDALAMLGDGTAGQQQMLAAMALHLEVPGETYLVGEVLDPDGRPDPNGEDKWTVYSNEELKPKGSDTGLWELDRGDGKKRTISEDDAWVIRIWHSHPRKYLEADSPARAALPILREIEQLTKKIAAEVDSRLAGAGILFVPTEMTFSAAAAPGVAMGQVNTEGEADPLAEPVVAQQDVNKFLADLIEAMVTPIANRDHPSSVVPIVVKAPGALLANIKHITFDTPLDKRTLETRDASMKRLATTADMPAEIVLGIGDVNHWGAWQLEESAIKIHVTPLGDVMTSGLTDQWLRLAVKALGGVFNPRRRIGLDTSNLRLRPDRSEQAIQLFNLLELSGEALRRETGFDEGDAPKPEEVKAAILRKIAAGVLTPDMVLAALEVLGVKLDVKPVETRTGLDPAEVGAEPPTPALPAPAEQGPPADDKPTPEAPPQAASAAEVAVLASAELLVRRAVERANNRVNNRGKVRRPVPADKLDAALAGAWDDVPRTAELLGLDTVWFTKRLDTYARAMLTTGDEHQPQVLEKVLGS